MRIIQVIVWMGLFSIVLPWTYGDEVQVEEVEGSVLYGAGHTIPSLPIKAGDHFGPGTFDANNKGKLILSAFPGSSLQLAEAGRLIFRGFQMSVIHPGLREAAFELEEGKLTIILVATTSAPTVDYLVKVKRGQLCVRSAMAMLCGHGDGTYIYVARGDVELFSGVGPNIKKPLELLANGSIGVLESNGLFRIRPLNEVSPATQNCLLAGIKADIAGGGAGEGAGAANPANESTDVPNIFNLSIEPPVSPSQ